MSYNNFKPTIWSKFIQQSLEKKAKLTDFCNRQFEGEARKGETVRILNAYSPTIFDYDQKNGIAGNPETFEDGTYAELKMNVFKAFRFMIDDIDRMQTIPGTFEAILLEKGKKLLEARERYVGSLALDFATAVAGGEKFTDCADQISGSVEIKTEKAARNAIDEGILALRQNDVAIDDDVHIELSPRVYRMFKNDIIDIKTNNVDLLNRGVVGMYDGCLVVVSNCLANDGTDDYCMIRTKNAIAFASGIDEMEAYRPENYFSDAVKGLNVYGGVIVRPKELYVLKAHA